MIINSRNIPTTDILPSISPPPSQVSTSDYNRINSINYEKSQILIKNTINSLINPTIDFFSAISVTKAEFEQTQLEAQQLTNDFTLSTFIDIITLPKLILIHKHMMELFNYLTSLNQTFEWNLFKKIVDPMLLKQKMYKIDYTKLSRKQFNFYLNRLSNNSFDFPKFMPYSLGLNHLYKWVLCQVKLYTYYLNEVKILKNEFIKNSRVISIEKEEVENKFENKVKKLGIINFNNVFNNNNNGSLSLNNSDVSTTRNYISICKSIDVSSTTNHNSNVNMNNCNVTNNDMVIHPIKKKYDFNINRQQDDNAVVTDDIMLTKVPGQSSSVVVKESNNVNGSNSSSNNGNIRKQVLKESSLMLNGINVMEDKKKREMFVMKSIPLIKHKTFEQMRKYYKIRSGNDSKIESKHHEDVKQCNIKEMKDKRKFISMIANNRMELLESMPEETFLELLE